MSAVDWRLAPIGTTGAMIANFDSLAAGGKTFVGKVEFIPSDEPDRATYREGPDSWAYYEAPPAWNGEGLPPVGAVCEINHVGECDSNGRLWRQVTILAHYSDIRLQSQIAIYMPIDGSASCDQAIAECFRPLRTPKQIAAEERDAACRQMCIDAGGSVCDAQMAKAYMLYDQGYRKQPDA